MLSKYVRNDDCGCGGGKYNCVTKNTLNKWLQAELKRLDCGCGCKGWKGFNKKYGKVGGAKILADCPPGWRNDGLTCVEPCNADEFDDGLTCRKKCAPGQIDDGLTCRNPIKSEMNSCPAGSRDIAGTCWGPVRRDCVDDCFKHPAPGCRTWECGRLRGAFGEDWGPRWCTDCNLRCGQTCWDVQGITKQLHERNLRVWGGEVFGQQIRGKQIRGRVDFDELGKAVTAGLNDLFSADGALARAFDPEKNGVGAAFRKFGDDMKRVLEEVGNSIKNAFDRMGADIKKAFEDFAKDAESKFKQFGEDFVNKMKDPDFWVEAIGIMAQIAAAAVSIAITVGTLGAGTGLAVGLMAAAQMAGPAAKMIADAARGRPIDVLDIVQLGISAATALVPGMSSTVGAMVKTGANAAKYVVQGVQVGQQLGIIPSSCIANCPPDPPDRTEPPIIPTPPPSDVPPPPGQKTDQEILDLAPPCTFIRVIGKPNQPAPCNVPPKVTRTGPPYYTEEEWIAKYRAENYGPDAANQTVEDESGALVPKEDEDIKGEVDATQGEEVDMTDVKVPELDEIDFGEAPTEEIDFGEAPTEEIDFGEAPTGDIDFGEELGAGKKRRKRRGGKLGPIIEPVTVDGVLTNPGGTMVSLPAKANIPKAHTGEDFNPDCYARKNPELAQAVGNDKEKLITHWLEIGSKEGWDASCGPATTEEERTKAFEELSKRQANAEALKTACNATNRFWVESTATCDRLRNADGTANTKAEKCEENNNYWDHSAKPSLCNKYKTKDGRDKTTKERCNEMNSFFTGEFNRCDRTKNVDGTSKTKADHCSGLNAFWTGSTCDVTKDNDGKPVVEKDMCESANNYWAKEKCVFGEISMDGNAYEIEYTRNGVKVRHPVPNLDGFIPPEPGIPGPHIKCVPTNDYNCNEQKDKDGKRKGSVKFCQENLSGVIDTNTKACKPSTGPSSIPRIPATIAELKQDLELQLPEKAIEEDPEVLRQKTEKARKESLLSCMKQKRNHLPPTVNGQQKDRAILYTIENLEKVEKGEKLFNNMNQLYDECKAQGNGKPQKSLTLYYANWCPHCHDMMPEWKKLGGSYKGIKIQAIEQKRMKRKDINGFPTILFSDGQRETKYEGPRTKSGFVKFLKNNLK